MFEESNIEDVEQDENNDEVTSLTAEPPETLEEAGFEGFGIGDADTAEGQARRAEEAHFEEVREDSDKVEEGFLGEEVKELQEEVEDLDDLPTPSEAELGELCRVPSEGQFQFCELVDDDSSELIGFLEEEESDENDVGDITEGVSILEEIESEFDSLTGGEE